MCTTCGCDDVAGTRVTDLASWSPGDGHGTPLHHVHEPGHQHPEPSRTVVLEQQILAKNDSAAAGNRRWLSERGIFAVNLMSSPGSGKTTLLERSVRAVGAGLTLTVIEGDQETLFDAERIRATGCRVVQVNTGAGCHLDAQMVATALSALSPPAGSLLFIENVGNLVCPALFDLGEASKVVVISVTEGADKPQKYPKMFRAADLVLLNKVDLLPYVDFDLERFRTGVSGLNPQVRVLPVSATRGDGIDEWCSYLRANVG